MKHIVVIGSGAGVDLITKEALSAIAETDVLFGTERLVTMHKDNMKCGITHCVYKTAEIIKLINESTAEKFAVLVSGDTGFYSAANSILAESLSLSDSDISFIPGVSSVSVFFARLKMPWQDAVFFSAHGRDHRNLVSMVRRNAYVFCLTGNNTKLIGQTLCDAGFGDIKVCVGIVLGSENEKIFWTCTKELCLDSVTIRGENKSTVLPSLCVLLFKNEVPLDNVRFGIADDEFVRLPKTPMTKSEVRAVVMSKLSVMPDDVCWDVGAGTGSVSVEMAIAAWRGRVFAVEKEDGAAQLIKENCRKFHLGNVFVVCGTAPQELLALPAPDIVFVGGSSGKTKEIIDAARLKNPLVRIVITAISIETSAAVLAYNPDASLVQIAASRYKKTGGSNLLFAQNPITIITLENRT